MRRVFETALRLGYSLLLWILLPGTTFYLVWRGLKQSAYLQRWSERFALYAVPGEPRCLWIHAVSVGEFNAIIDLAKRLCESHPQLPLLITTTTPTGSARVRQVFGDQVRHVYLPYDTPGAVRHFYEHFNPMIGLIVETEIWPNLIHEGRARGLPLVIVNARLSKRSMRGYASSASLWRMALSEVDAVLAQSNMDADRFRRLGLPSDRIKVTGNLKFDTRTPQAPPSLMLWRKLNPRPIWCAASTHPGEHAAVLEAHALVRARYPSALLIWAPRHPEVFADARKAMDAVGLSYAQRSDSAYADAQQQVLLVDTIGELNQLLSVADIAFVGGSLIEVGGQNVLEAATHSVPVLVGPHTANFADSVALLLEQSAAQRITDASSLAKAVIEAFRDPARAQARGAAGKLAVESQRGALQRTLDGIAPFLVASQDSAERP